MVSSDRPLSAVLQDIFGNVQDIVRAEIRLAKTEAGEAVTKARSAAVLVGIGACAGILSATFALLAAVYALALVVPDWAAALIVAVAVGLLAAVAIALGVKSFKSIRAAPRTAASMKENVEWTRHLTK